MACASSRRPLPLRKILSSPPPRQAQEPRRRGRARVIRIPADKDMPGRRRRQVFDGHRPRRRAVIGGLREHRVVPDANRARVVAVSLRVDEFELIDGDIRRRRRTAKHGPKLLAFRIVERLRAVAFRERGGISSREVAQGGDGFPLSSVSSRPGTFAGASCRGPPGRKLAGWNRRRGVP